jgi:glutaredoxin
MIIKLGKKMGKWLDNRGEDLSLRIVTNICKICNIHGNYHEVLLPCKHDDCVKNARFCTKCLNAKHNPWYEEQKIKKEEKRQKMIKQLEEEIQRQERTIQRQERPTTRRRIRFRY